MFAFMRRRRRPDPAELIDQLLAARDYRNAAVLILTSCAEIVYEARAEARATHAPDIQTATLRLALARVANG